MHRQTIAALSRRLAHRVGRRGFSLLFLSLLDMLFALSLASTPSGPPNPLTLFLAHVLPLPAWAAVWGLVGVVCLVQAFARQDRIAFTLAVLLKLTWGLLYGAAWALYGINRGWVAAVVWLAFGAWVAVVSTWPEQPTDTYGGGVPTVTR